MFKQENALPGAKLHSAIGNWHSLAGARHDHADVRRHVVAAFRAVTEVIGILRDQAVEEFLQVAACARICILHDDKAATGVLNKNCSCSVTHTAFVDLRLHFVCDFVQAFSICANVDLVVVDMHFERCYSLWPLGKARNDGSGSRHFLLFSVVSRPPFLEHDRPLITALADGLLT
jgi:hypothetical protein